MSIDEEEKTKEAKGGGAKEEARGKHREIKDDKEEGEKEDRGERQRGGQTREGGPQERKTGFGGG